MKQTHSLKHVYLILGAARDCVADSRQLLLVWRKLRYVSRRYLHLKELRSYVAGDSRCAYTPSADTYAIAEGIRPMQFSITGGQWWWKSMHSIPLICKMLTWPLNSHNCSCRNNTHKKYIYIPLLTDYLQLLNSEQILVPNLRNFFRSQKYLIIMSS